MAQDNAAEKKQPKSFEALTPELSSWILDFTKGMGFSRTTPVQAMAIPLLMGNKDLVVEAVTGSGKTLSFLIPLVERILKADEPNKKGHVRSIVVAPTKELASQIYDVLIGLLDFHPPSAAMLRRLAAPEEDSEDEDMDPAPVEEVPPGPYAIPQLLVGGRTKAAEDTAAFTKLNPNILIGTPRRLIEVLQSSKVVLKRHWFDLLVLDEADRLLDPNFQPDLQKILEILPKERRTGLFSASVSEAVDELVRVGLRYPFKISAKVRSKSGALDKRTPESLKLYHLITQPSLKIPHLQHLLATTQADKSIVYVSTRAAVDYWHQILPALLPGVTVHPLHGDHKAAIRSKNLQRFRDAPTPALLLTTDVLARGIDIPDVDLVVQLDPPKQPKDFIHRCGRTGRAGKRGQAVTFLCAGPEEDYIKYLALQGTVLEAYPGAARLVDAHAAETTAAIQRRVASKREWHDRAQKAFVSWVQAYSKTLPADIFAVRHVAWPETGRAWGLLRWPKMPELKRHCAAAVADRAYGLALPPDVDIHAVPYADKVREARRRAEGEARARGEKVAGEARLGGRAAQAKMRKERAWSDQKGAKRVREERREKKVVRRKAESEAKMSEVEKRQARELEDLVTQVREQTVANMEDDFDGFSD
jgi:ATP-dependent RNA helicase DDX55/SPB4